MYIRFEGKFNCFFTIFMLFLNLRFTVGFEPGYVDDFSCLLVCFYFEFSESSCLSLLNFYMNLMPTHIPFLRIVVNLLRSTVV